MNSAGLAPNIAVIKPKICSNPDLVSKLKPEELTAFKAAFDMFDKNTDGTISTKVIIASNKTCKIICEIIGVSYIYVQG